MYALWYFEIHLIRFIWSYCIFIYNEYVILLCYVINHHNSLVITQISNQLICDILYHGFSLQTGSSSIILKHKLPTQIKHWTTRIYQGLNDCCEENCDSDLNYMSLVILRQYTNVTNQCWKLTWTWTWHIQYYNHWSHFEKFPGRF